MPALRIPILACSLALLLGACNTQNVRPVEDAPAAASAPPAKAPRTPAPPADETPPEFEGPRVVFAPGSSELPRAATAVLDDVAAKLKADPLVNVTLIGHTEDLGSREFSMAVASKCTQAVGQALVKRGARPSQIRMMPRGHEKTAAKRCTTNACRKQLRRVDIVMSEY